MICPYCKSNIKSGLKFCTNCGQSLEIAMQESATPMTVSEPVVSRVPPPYASTGIKPGRWLYALSALILVAGIASFVLVLLNGLKSMEGSLARIAVPGKYDINLKEPGKYIVFYEYRSVIGNKVYETGLRIPNISCSIASKATGQQITLSSPSASYSYSTGKAGIGVLEFTIGQPGHYEISAWYSEGRQGPEIVLAIGKGFGTQLMTTIITCIAILGGSVALAIAIFIITLIKRRRVKQALTQ